MTSGKGLASRGDRLTISGRLLAQALPLRHSRNCDVRQLDDLRHIKMRVGSKTENNIRTGIGVRHHSGLWGHILPGKVVDPHWHACLFGIALRVHLEYCLIAVNEFGWPEHTKRRPSLDLQLRSCHVRGNDCSAGWQCS